VRVAGADVDIVGSAEAPQGGFEVWAPRERVAQVWDTLLERVEQRGGRAVGWTAAEALRIEAGLTRHGFDYDEESFPAEVNQAHRLTYDKCYVGQEVVARMRTYGHPNNLLFHTTCLGAGAGAGSETSGLLPGARVLSGTELAGRITSSCYSYRWQKPLGFAMISRKYWTNRELRLEGGGAIEIAALPEQIG
jgi:folate-binding protein YgfZ